MAIVNFVDLSTSGFDEDALTTTKSNEQVLNHGSLTTTGDLANGIFAGANDVLIQNFGLIETSGLGAAGIYVQGENARIENHGSVVTHGGFFDDGGDGVFSEGIFAEGDRFYIANHGRVQVSGDGSSAMVGDGADGRVINFGIVDSSAPFSAVIAAFGDRSEVINAGSGEVIARGEGPVLFVLGQDASALNHGQITIEGLNNGIEGRGQNTHLTNQGVISISDDADGSLGMVGLGSGHQISNFELIETHGSFTLGIGARDLPGGSGLDFEIVNAGRIATEGDLAIGVVLGAGRLQFGFAPATNGEIENSGVIETVGVGAAGVVMIGDGHHLTNRGRITTDGGAFDGATVGLPIGELSAAGVVVSGDDALLENTRTGVIESKNAASAAVELNVLERDGLSNADTSSTLENFGLIKGAAVAVLGGTGQETVINHGRIVGDVVLGDGADTFVFGKGGVLDGALLLGGGDDLVLIEDGSGTSRIQDFVAGAGTDDVIDVTAFFSSFEELQVASSVNEGGDVVVALDHNDVLIIGSVQLSALNAGDFLFG